MALSTIASDKSGECPQLPFISTFEGDPLLANGEVKFYGQPYFAVLATSVHLARKAALKGTIKVIPTAAVFTTEKLTKTLNTPTERLGFLYRQNRHPCGAYLPSHDAA